MSPLGRWDCRTPGRIDNRPSAVTRKSRRVPRTCVRDGHSHHALGAAHRGGGRGRVPQPRAEERESGLDGPLRVADRASRIPFRARRAGLARPRTISAPPSRSSQEVARSPQQLSLRVADRIPESQGSSQGQRSARPGWTGHSESLTAPRASQSRKDRRPIPARLASGGLAAVAASGDESGAASAFSDRKR